MARAQASRIIDAPVEAVWAAVRDFDALPSWVPAITRSSIEGGLDADVVGCVRAIHLGEQLVRERLLMLDDTRYRFAYNFETPAFPVENYVAEFELIPVTDGDRCFARWSADFDEAPQDAGRYERIVSRDVFAAGLESLSALVAGRQTPGDAPRWQGDRPAKVFCSSVLHAPVEAAWSRMRDFAGMAEWHPEISAMTMLGGVRPDKVSGERDFRFGRGHLNERLTLLCDRSHAFAYRITASDTPWLNYHAAARLRPISATGETFAVWTADWTASPEDDLRLIPMVHTDVFQKAFDTLNQRYFFA